MTPRERAETLLLTFGTLVLVLGLQWMTRVMLLSVATVETYWWLELVGLAAGIVWASLGCFTAAPFGKVVMAWLLVTAGLIWGIGPLVTSPEQARWLPLVPRGAAWAIETLGQGTLDVLLGRRDPAFWPPRTARASLAGMLLAVFALPLALRLTETAVRELRPSRRHSGGNRYRSTETVFGDADWGTWAAMRKTVADPGGIVLGEDYDPRRNPMAFRTDDPKTWGRGGRSELITLRTSYISGHVLVVSGAGGGKSAGIVIPTCLTYRKPVVVVDPDGEILARTGAAREAMGHSIRVIKPGQGFDMLKLLESQFDRTDMSYLHVAGIITEDERLHTDGLSDYFKTEATKVIAALLAHYCKVGVTSPLAEIVRLISLELPLFKAEIARIADAHEPGHFVQIYLGNYRDPEPRFFQSFQNTVGQALKWVPYPEYLAMYTSDPDGSKPLLGAKTDIFIQVTKSDMKENPTLVRLIIGSILYVADHRQGDDAPDERLVIVDEAAVVGRMKIFESIRDTARKKRLHLMMIFQSQGQIEHLYGRPGLQSWMNGVSARVFSGIEALDECRALSEIVGSYTADVDGESRSVSSKPGLFSGVSQSVSSSNSLREAKLISPDQIRTLPGDAALVLVKGQRPLVAGIAFWFRRAEWADASSPLSDGNSISLRDLILGHGATLRTRSRSKAALVGSSGTTP